LHFFHKNVIHYCNRPWTFEEQTEEIVTRWNSRVGPDDEVFSLGDLFFGKSVSRVNEIINIINRLNGKITLVTGNHCHWRAMARIANECTNVVAVCDYTKKHINGQTIVMSHYPMAVWDHAHYGSWMLHGHCHGSYQPDLGLILDVGIDNHPDYQIWSFDEVAAYMSKRTRFTPDGHNK
jgi:calcineurin-like phosphoesterase family protein